MKIFETVDDYLKVAQANDIIVLGGKGILNGIKTLESKHDTHKVHSNTTKEKLVVREYRGRVNYVLGANGYDQKVAVLTNSEFKNLKVLW